MLVIEKVVKLLDDFHYEVLKQHVRHHSKRSYYPQTLFEQINRELMAKQTSEELCANTYEDEEVNEATLKKFYQLAHHTFKLTAHLARNYPDYLHHNISRIQALINQGELKKANFLAEILLEIVGKTEDHHTEIRLLQLLAQKEILLESYDKALKYQDRVRELLEYEQTLNEIISYFYTHLNSKKKFKASDLEHTAYFKQFHEHSVTTIRTISKYYYCFTFNLLRDPFFNSKEMLTILSDLESDLERSDYVVFPYMTDCLQRVRFLKLQVLALHSEGRQILEETEAFMDSGQEILFWNSFVNFMDIIAYSVETRFFSEHYMRSYREDHYKSIPVELKEKLERSKLRCKTLIQNEDLQNKFTLKYIVLITTYSLFLCCGSKNDLKEAARQLEGLLINFQQIPFHAYIDPIYSILIFAHFSLGNYTEVDEHYKRYRRTTKGKIVHTENDLSLHGFYYASKWVETQRKQYLKKLGAVIEQVKLSASSKRTLNMLNDIVDYYQIPLE